MLDILNGLDEAAWAGLTALVLPTARAFRMTANGKTQQRHAEEVLQATRRRFSAPGLSQGWNTESSALGHGLII